MVCVSASVSAGASVSADASGSTGATGSMNVRVGSSVSTSAVEMHTSQSNNTCAPQLRCMYPTSILSVMHQEKPDLLICSGS